MIDAETYKDRRQTIKIRKRTTLDQLTQAFNRTKVARDEYEKCLKHESSLERALANLERAENKLLEEL